MPRNLALIDDAPQGTAEPVTPFDRMRDAVGEYPAHARFGEPDCDAGEEILDVLAELQVIYADAVDGITAVLARSGHRSAQFLRNQKTGAAQPTLADRAVLRVTRPDRYKQMLIEEVLREGGRCEFGAKVGRTFAASIADLQAAVASLTSTYLIATADGTITEAERHTLAVSVAAAKKLIGDVEQYCAPHHPPTGHGPKQVVTADRPIGGQR